jgi:hypothetical protein
MSIIGSLLAGAATPLPKSPPSPPPQPEENGRIAGNQSNETLNFTETNFSETNSEQSSGLADSSAGFTPLNPAGSQADSPAPISESVTQFSSSNGSPSVSELALYLPETLVSNKIELSEEQLSAITTNPSGDFESSASNLYALLEPSDPASLATPASSAIEPTTPDLGDAVKSFYSVSNPDNEIETILEEFF